jgi:hypothetical protein
MDILPGAAPLMVDVRQSGPGPEDQIKAINAVTLKRMEDRLIDIQKKVKDDDD